LFLDNFIMAVSGWGAPTAVGCGLFFPGLPVWQWDRQVFLGTFLFLLADHWYCSEKPDTQNPPPMF